jgi:hypothetical protein
VDVSDEKPDTPNDKDEATPQPDSNGDSGGGSRGSRGSNNANWLDRLTTSLKQLRGAVLAAVGVLCAIAAAIAAISQIGSAAKVTGSSSPLTVISSTPAPTPSPTRTPTPSPTVPATLVVTETCHLSSTPQQGAQVNLTYTIVANESATVGLGAGIYDPSGNDQSTGTGDLDGYPIHSGTQTVTRPLPIPSDLSSGTYEITGEIWPSGQIGADGANTIAEAACAYMKVP